MRIGWQVWSTSRFAATLVEATPARPGLMVIALDGHSSSGKTTLAARLAATLPDAGVVHSDDLAWHHGVFTWDRLLVDDVLPVVRSGAALDYRPPQWRARQREGSIRLPGGLRHLILEGVGASMAAVAAEVDVVVWVETDEPTRGERGALRVAVGETTPSGELAWMVQENAYVTAHRPWRRAHWLVEGGDSWPHDPDTEVVVAPGPAGTERVR